METDFSLMVSAALDAFYRDDWLPTLILADLLDERGDERGKRLRKRFKTVSRRIEWTREKIARYVLNSDPQLYRGQTGFQLLELCLSEITRAWVSYFIRLMSVKSGERVPRPTVSGGYLLSEPAA